MYMSDAKEFFLVNVVYFKFTYHLSLFPFQQERKQGQ